MIPDRNPLCQAPKPLVVERPIRDTTVFLLESIFFCLLCRHLLSGRSFLLPRPSSVPSPPWLLLHHPLPKNDLTTPTFSLFNLLVLSRVNEWQPNRV